jgi:hypothetical protein
MFNLLLLSLALSAPSAAVQAGVSPDAPLTVEQPPSVLLHHGMPLQLIEEQPAKAYEVRTVPSGEDICFKIRAYVFSKGPDPKLLRETTCGPLPATTKRIDGSKPRLVPLDANGDGTMGTLSRR